MSHAFGSRLVTHIALLPTGIYTIPEIGMAGETEDALKRKDVTTLSGADSSLFLLSVRSDQRGERRRRTGPQHGPREETISLFQLSLCRVDGNQKNRAQ
jgi:hypothetical protein